MEITATAMPLNTLFANASASVPAFPATPDNTVPKREQSPAPIEAQVVDEGEKVEVFSKGLEAFFTAAVIFSTALMPFVLLQILAPGFMSTIVSSPLVWLIVPYVIIMALVGIRIAAMFGCSMWDRINQPKTLGLMRK